MSTPTRRRAVEKTEENEPRRARRGDGGDGVQGQDMDAAAALGPVPAPLRDPSYSPPTNLPREANAILRLQRTLGNAHVQRLVENPGREKPGSPSRALPDETVERIDAAHGAGQPLEPQLRTEMEAALGQDFGGVRLHTGPEADALAEDLEARAFTTGHDIFFRNGAYDPTSPAGRETLGHELAHVVQQTHANGTLAPSLSAPSDTAEIEAGALGAQIGREGGLRNLRPSDLSSDATVQRQDPTPGPAPVPTPYPSAAEGGPAPGPAPSPRAALALAMWRSGVVGPQTRAHELLGSPNKGNIATALELLGSAHSAASALANTLPAESYPRARISQYRNALYGVIADLGPHAGEIVPIEDIRATSDPAAARQAEVEAALQQEEIVVPASGGV